MIHDLIGVDTTASYGDALEDEKWVHCSCGWLSYIRCGHDYCKRHAHKQHQLEVNRTTKEWKTI
jgi:hypothetical protein